MARSPDVVHIAVTCSDDSLFVLVFVVAEFNPDGTVRWSRRAETATIEAEIAKHALSMPPGPIKGWRPINKNDLPEGRKYRNAWRDRGTHVDHDLGHVKDIALFHLRRKRKEQLADLDARWMRANGQGKKAEADALEKERQALRDRPQQFVAAVENAKTVDEIDAALEGLGA